MKQNISCRKCIKEYEGIAIDVEVVAAGEKITIITGSALGPMLCDHCGASIATGHGCAAVGVVAPGQRDYPGWHLRFISTDPLPEPPAAA